MPSYLIYLPDKRGARPEHLADVGLGELLGGSEGNYSTLEYGDVLAGGPDGGAGLVCRWFDAKHPQRSPRLGVFEGQHWTKFERFWLGRESAISPEDLARPSQYDSTPVRLADGQVWLVPIARALPHTWGVDEHGVFRRVIQTPFEQYFLDSQKYFDRVLAATAEEGNVVQFGPFAECWEFACRALALNYLLAPPIVSWLGLIDDTCWMQLIGASFELGQLDAVQKKTASPAPAT